MSSFFWVQCDICGHQEYTSRQLLIDKRWAKDTKSERYRCPGCLFAWVNESVSIMAAAQREFERLMDVEQTLCAAKGYDSTDIAIRCGTCAHFERRSQSCVLLGHCDIGHGAWVSKYEEVRRPGAKDATAKLAEARLTAGNKPSPTLKRRASGPNVVGNGTLYFIGGKNGKRQTV